MHAHARMGIKHLAMAAPTRHPWHACSVHRAERGSSSRPLSGRETCAEPASTADSVHRGCMTRGGIGNRSGTPRSSNIAAVCRERVWQSRMSDAI